MDLLATMPAATSAAKEKPFLRFGAWRKIRVNQGRELVIAGYTPSANNFDALIIGYYEGSELIYVARNPKWVYTSVSRGAVQEAEATGNSSLPVRELARKEGRSLGCGAHCFQDDRLPVAQASVGCAV